MDKFLFRETISGWEDWSRVFQSIPLFTPLALEAFAKSKLPFAPLSLLSPGTNAVFRSGRYVIKLFAPKESGLDGSLDFHNEAAVCRRLAAQKIPTPRLLAKGELRDKYLFYYLISEYVEGREAGTYLACANTAQKKDFALRLRRLLSAVNLPADGLISPVDLAARALDGPRIHGLPLPLQADFRRRVESLDLSSKVLVHGDLTGENLLVGEDGSLTVIDCADACLAPAWYELAPIVFELFRCDGELLRTFFGAERDSLLERTLDALCIHDFGSSLVLETARRNGLPANAFSSLSDIKLFLLERMT